MVIIFLLVIAVNLLWIFPSLTRDIEQSKRRLFSGYGLIVFGRTIFSGSAAFYRITAYEDFFVLVCIGGQRIDYVHAYNVRYAVGSFASLKMSLRGSPLQIYATRNFLRRLEDQILAAGKKLNNDND